MESQNPELAYWALLICESQKSGLKFESQKYEKF